MNYLTTIQNIQKQLNPFSSEGKIPSAIPELEIIDPNKFGIHILTMEGEDYGVGDSEERFSIQSISKVLSLALATQYLNDRIWERVGVEPSGNPFNSLVQLEYEQGKPRNPFINAGAIVIADILLSCLPNPKDDFLSFVRLISQSESLQYNEAVVRSEKTVIYRNAALANMLKSFGNLENNVDDVLDFYISHCAIEMSCRELSHAFSFFANGGYTLNTSQKILSESQVKRLNALMLTCGFYDESGEFAYKVGLPGKSGIGGGIIAVHPNQYCVSTWSPRLNEKGNSVLGFKALELLTTETMMSIF